jgi:hypothetical protein
VARGEVKRSSKYEGLVERMRKMKIGEYIEVENPNGDEPKRLSQVIGMMIQARLRPTDEHRNYTVSREGGAVWIVRTEPRQVSTRALRRSAANESAKPASKPASKACVGNSGTVCPSTTSEGLVTRRV